jgi:hypothetical protein
MTASSALDITVEVKAAVITAIQTLGLTSDDGSLTIGSNVLDQMIEDESNVMWPAIIVTQHGQQDSNFSSTFETEHWWIPMLVVIGDRRSARDQLNTPTYASWRSQIRDYFQHQPLKVAGVHQCVVVPKAITDADLKKFQYVQAALLLRFIISVTRTINV